MAKSHYFDPDIAQKVGVYAAIIYEFVCHYVDHNRDYEPNIHDGKAWTRYSVKQFEHEYPYLTQKQIRNAVRALEDAGMIESSSSFNSTPYDHTKWYTVTDPSISSIQENDTSDLPYRANHDAKEGKTYIYINNSHLNKNCNKNFNNTIAQSDKNDVAAEPEADVEAIPLNDGTEWRPTVSAYNELVRLHPNVDVPYQFMKMRGWCDNNPQKKKTKRGIRKFVNHWLDGEQDKYHASASVLQTTNHSAKSQQSAQYSETKWR